MELIGAPGGESCTVVEFLNFRINLREKEAYKEVEHVDFEDVGDDIEVLDQVKAQNIDTSDGQGTNPVAEHVRRGLVEKMLVLSRHHEFPARYGTIQ
ncbi:hypothetical protein HN51_031302 [Arachis hypogaea]